MSPIQRAVSAFLALTLASVALVHYGRLKSEHGRVLLMLRETGLADRQPQVAKRVQRVRDIQWAKLAVARALLAEAYDQRWLQNLEPSQRQQEIAKLGERLELARDLATEVLSTRPATWQAAMILGGASLYESVGSGTPGVITAREPWEKPLRAALGLAPGEEEPRSLLAGAYLGTEISFVLSRRWRTAHWTLAVHVYGHPFRLDDVDEVDEVTDIASATIWPYYILRFMYLGWSPMGNPSAISVTSGCSVFTPQSFVTVSKVC